MKYNNALTQEKYEAHLSYLSGNTNGERLSLAGADLYGAALSGANLSGANLSYADLSGAALDGATLNNCTGNSKEVFSFQFPKYTVVWVLPTKVLHIGCKSHSKEEWFNFSDEEIRAMAPNALEWWNKYKGTIDTLCT